MFECVLGLLGNNTKHKFQKIEQENKNRLFFITIDDAIKKIDLKETYLRDLGDKYINDIRKIDRIQNDPLKKHKQKNLFKIYKLYNAQRAKLLNIRFNMEQLRINMEEGTYLQDIYKVLFEGNKRLEYLNKKMEHEDVDTIMQDLKDSIENLNEKSEIISSPIDDNGYQNGNNNDDDLDKELENLINSTKIDNAMTNDKNGGQRPPFARGGNDSAKKIENYNDLENLSYIPTESQKYNNHIKNNSSEKTIVHSTHSAPSETILNKSESERKTIIVSTPQSKGTKNYEVV